MFGRATIRLGIGPHSSLNEPLDPFPFFGWLLNKKAARVEVNISLAFFTGYG